MPAPLSPLLVDGLVHDAAAVAPGTLGVTAAVAAHVDHLDASYGELVGPLLVPAAAIEELRVAAPPDGLLQIVIVADDGLLGLAEARHAVQDDPWTEPAYLQIAVPDGFDPASATDAMLEELAFTVPTHVELPRTGFEAALDVLAADGAERAAYRCCGPAAGGVPTAGELAEFIHAAVSRKVAFSLMAGHGHLLRGASGDGAPQHGLLNVLAAVAAALDGASTSAVAELLDVTASDVLLEVAASVPPLQVRSTFIGFACTDVAAPATELLGLTDLSGN